MSPRHQLTPEDRRKGGLSHAKKYGHQGHKLTQADRRRGGLATAAKQRAPRRLSKASSLTTLGALYPAASPFRERTATLPTGSHVRVRDLSAFPAWKGEHLVVGHEGPYVLLANPEGPLRATGGPGKFRPESLEPAKSTAALPPEPSKDPHTPGCAYAGDVNVAGCCEGYPLLKELSTEPTPPHHDSATGERPSCHLDGSLPPDPFTLSALKRFRLGPLSPLALTRSQRAHVDIMLAGGWVEKTPEAMIRLTAKGETALNATENE